MKQKNFNVNNVFYGVIGIATFMVAVMGATFAYFTATASNNNTIVGNMATVGIDVIVEKMTKVDETKGGLIPMSNNMVEQAITKNTICVDDNGNAVCQIYKITVTNESSASMFVDGYVTLSGGSGVSVDYDLASDGIQDYVYNTTGTTMRWAQAFCSAESGGVVTTCTTAGTSTIRIDADATAITYSALGGESTKANGTNIAEIKNTRANVANASDSTGAAVINGNKYEAINKNYIRVSDHTLDSYKYNRDNDTTSALVYNQYLEPNASKAAAQTGNSSSTYTYSQVYYIVVWLAENGYNQTVGSGNTNVPTSKDNFFKGNATFITSQGNEVTATFNGHTRITPDTPKS